MKGNGLWVEKYGVASVAMAFTLWGMLPLYYQYLPAAPADELLSIRIVASVPLALIMVWLFGNPAEFKQVLNDKTSLRYTLLASLMMSVCWTAFTWAMTHERVFDASLGFFISPLTLVALGVIAYRERLTRHQKIALVFATAGLLVLISQSEQAPVAALLMAIFFALYAWCKRKCHYSWTMGLFLEVLMLSPLALIYLVYVETSRGTQMLAGDWTLVAFYLGSAPMFLLPLLFYCIAIRHVSMAKIGLLQYIEPSIQFFIALALFNEPLNPVKLASFILIWSGLTISVVGPRYRLARGAAR
ncbi:EamA family transporter RarD [Vibrio sp.]|uniref:EamA family transporter RarD n=1 Tax=Vibrio sp. TaxID=678 RepID=UPI003D149F3A